MYYAKPSDNCTYYVTQNNLCCGILHTSVHHYVHRRSMVQYTGTVGTLNSAIGSAECRDQRDPLHTAAIQQARQSLCEASDSSSRQ